jgi:hypothetical protein
MTWSPSSPQAVLIGGVSRHEDSAASWPKPVLTRHYRPVCGLLRAQFLLSGPLQAAECGFQEPVGFTGEKAPIQLQEFADTPFIATQWRHALRDLNVTVSFDAKRLLKLLLTLRTTTEPTLRDRILTLDSEITTLDQTIADREAELNAIIYRLYHLTPEEIAMVEGG